MSSHNCELHSPIVMRLAELQALEPYRWLLEPGDRYNAYGTIEEVDADAGARLDPAVDGLAQYRVRLIRMMRDAAPYLARWAAVYPQLSGVLTSDHA